MRKTSIKKLIKEALLKFLRKDKVVLLKIGVYEVTISHRIAVYLENRFKEYDIDCEYNKNLEENKKLNNGQIIRPDIVIHKRNKNDNLCIIEVKKAGKGSKRAREDIEKLKESVKSFDYTIGLYIGVLKRRIDLCWIEKTNDTFQEEWEQI